MQLRLNSEAFEPVIVNILLKISWNFVFLQETLQYSLWTAPVLYVGLLHFSLYWEKNEKPECLLETRV